MGIFDSLKSLTKAAVDTALLPVDVVVDVTTMGRASDNEEPATVERIKKIAGKLQEAYDEIEE